MTIQNRGAFSLRLWMIPLGVNQAENASRMDESMKCQQRISFLVCLLFSMVAFAQPEPSRPLTLQLTTIEKIHATENQGDELYFSVTEYSSLDRPTHYEVPSFPTHWLSDHLENVKDVTLWSKRLKEGEGITLLVSLIERDAPPWNVDDLIGSIKVKLFQKDGKIEQKMSIPNRSNTQPMDDLHDGFVLSGDEGEYHLLFKIVP